METGCQRDAERLGRWAQPAGPKCHSTLDFQTTAVTRGCAACSSTCVCCYYWPPSFRLPAHSSLWPWPQGCRGLPKKAMSPCVCCRFIATHASLEGARCRLLGGRESVAKAGAGARTPVITQHTCLSFCVFILMSKKRWPKLAPCRAVWCRGALQQHNSCGNELLAETGHLCLQKQNFA